MPPEEAFNRTVAIELNNLLSVAKPALEALEVDIRTRSLDGRDYQIWDGRFTKSWPGPLRFERATVTIILYCMEPHKPTEVKDAEVRCDTIAEIFQIGQLSRVRATNEDKFVLEQLRSLGIQNVLLEKIEWGRNLLMSPQNWR